MATLGMQRSRSDATLYYYKSTAEDGALRWVLISVFVDDLLITGTDKAFMAKFKDHANKTFGKHQAVTWNETVTSFLGLQIPQQRLVYSVDNLGKLEDHESSQSSRR